MHSNFIRSSILILLGFLTFLLLEILPVAGGGVSLIVTITIPFIILIAIIMTIIYNSYYVPKKEAKVKNKAFFIMVLIIVALNILLFPHK